MPSENLHKRLTDREDNFVERKPAGVNRAEIRKTVVAFANSVSEDREGILFIGLKDNGDVDGIKNTDTLQKTIREVCEKDCFPAISFSSEVIDLDGSSVLAVSIPTSKNKPHFSGQAYIRKGSENIVASDSLFDELVYSRNSKCAAISKLRDQVVSVVTIQHRLGRAEKVIGTDYQERAECTVLFCDPHVVKLRNISSGEYVTEPLDHITLTYDERRYRKMLVVTGYG